jgi:hypothetical protein
MPAEQSNVTQFVLGRALGALDAVIGAAVLAVIALAVALLSNLALWQVLAYVMAPLLLAAVLGVGIRLAIRARRLLLTHTQWIATLDGRVAEFDGRVAEIARQTTTIEQRTRPPGALSHLLVRAAEDARRGTTGR